MAVARSNLRYPPLIDIDIGLGRGWGYDDRIRNHLTNFRRGTVERHRKFARCHPERENVGHDLCGACYVYRWKNLRGPRKIPHSVLTSST